MKFTLNLAPKALVCFCLVNLSFTAFGQKIMQDSRGKDILEYYKGGAIQGEFSPTQTSLAVSYSAVLGQPVYYYVNGDTTQKTVGKSNAISFKGKVEGSGTDAGKPFNLGKGLVRPSYRLEFGYQRTLDKFYRVALLPKGKPFAYSAGINLFAELQDINLYDTIAKVQTNRKPLIYGLHSHVTIFNKGGFSEGLFKTFGWAFSFSADLSSTYDSEAFISYQERTAAGYIDANIVALGDEAGNIGTFRRAGAYRLRAAVPLFLSKYINITPYASVYGFNGGSNHWLPGFSLNFFSGSPRSENSSLEQGFGIAVDWPKSKGANVAIYGSISFDKMNKAFKAIGI